MKRPKLKWVPDVHRPEMDFTAQRDGVHFKIFTFEGTSTLTVRLPIPGKMGCKRWLVEETYYKNPTLAKDGAEQYLEQP